MVAYFPDFWDGIGEIMARHDDLTALTYGETARANHVALDPIYRFAIEHDLPVYLHSNISSVTSRKPIYLHEMEELLTRHPRLKVVWAHCGISRRIVVPDLTQHLHALLTKHPCLFMDLSWIVSDLFVQKGGGDPRRVDPSDRGIPRSVDDRLRPGGQIPPVRRVRRQILAPPRRFEPRDRPKSGLLELPRRSPRSPSTHQVINNKCVTKSAICTRHFCLKSVRCRLHKNDHARRPH